MRPLPFPIVALADPGVLSQGLLDRVAEAAAGGLSWVCLRAPGMDPAAVAGLAQALRARCPGIFLSVRGGVELFRAAGAQGLHLPSRGEDPAAARSRLPEALIGVSYHSGEDLAAAQAAGADYAILSPLFAPVSKAAWLPALGEAGFRRALAGITLPVLALGGVTPERVAAAARAGAGGAAVLGSLFQCDDVAAQARRYRQAAALFPRAPGPSFRKG